MAIRTSSEVWDEAVETHARLLAGACLEAMNSPFPGLLREPGEYVVADIRGGMIFARYCAARVVYGNSGPTLVVGSQQFVTGFVLGSLALRGLRRWRARRAAAPQWRPAPLVRAVLTTRRLWCELATEHGTSWLYFNHDMISNLALDGTTLTLWFGDTAPLRLTGELAPWCAAVIAHFRFGPHAPQVVPALHAAALEG